jgi:Fe-S-cluster-containing hydrogenase component 2
MSFTIVASICEVDSVCVAVCPPQCIHEVRTIEGRVVTFIDSSKCTDCGACLFACPIEGAILDVWRPELQAIIRPGYVNLSPF